jgi:hypothetical protein
MFKKLACKITVFLSSLLVSLPVNALPNMDLVDYSIETETMTYVDANSVEKWNGIASAIMYLLPTPASTRKFGELSFLVECDCKNRTIRTVSTYLRNRITYNEWRTNLNAKAQKVVANSSGEMLFNYLCK